MAAMTTALTEFSDKENFRTWITTGHTVSKGKQVSQKRRTPSFSQETAEDVITVFHGCEDSSGDLLPGKVAFSVTIRRPKSAIAADVNAALAIIRDIVASDEFGDVVDEQKYLA